ncbi:uncharacterized protein HMPREF1541_05713 [Cyphellophora europaea CBS 101466]|uniref:Uncharacterized protein n=1 Tax=Cyphellophora europaea (strain CBS 101466) TaxID=1220924 RepID=W2RUP9_CYPE1|nr:uncharacterized protein HMPREF1541_05713 [Cyphellophora europaea CBS 101466]ETN39488.1 hypothetical protein HMPREF1541_05713 [Cyphellophora europaea CBS 101466]
MRDTLRRKPGKSVDLDANKLSPTTTISGALSESGSRHQRSVSNASVVAGGAGEKNPWSTDDPLTPSTRDRFVDSPDGRGRTQALDVPASERSERSVSEKPTRRRKKTLNQVTPHRFELVDAKRDSIRVPLPNDSPSQTPSEDIVVSKTREHGSTHSEDSVPSLSFSPIRAVGHVPQIKPREQRRDFSTIHVAASISPIAPPSPPTPPDSISTSPKRQPAGLGVDFLGMNFGASRNIAGNPFVTPPTSSSTQHKEPPSVTDGHRAPSNTHEPYTYRPQTLPLPPGSLLNKVIIVTNGTSLVSAPLIRTLHLAGARVVFSAHQSLADKARSFIRGLGPPDTIHFNACDLGCYTDIHALFKLAVTMYGRVDHAVFAPGDDGGQARGVGTGEKLWGLDVGLAEGRAMTGKAEMELVDRGETRDADNIDMSDIIAASVRFARVAMAYLRNSPGRRQVHSSSSGMLTPTSGGFSGAEWSEDRSLTFVSSTAAFTPLPYLPLYSTAQHAILGLARSLGESVDVRRDGVRVNLVATNMLLPSVVEAEGGGRMSVRVPGDKGDDVSNIVAGVIAEGLHHDGEVLHGRVLYAIGEDAVDVQDGLRENESAWMGIRAKEALDRASGKMDGAETGTESGTGKWKGRWMLMDSLDSPF